MKISKNSIDNLSSQKIGTDKIAGGQKHMDAEPISNELENVLGENLGVESNKQPSLTGKYAPKQRINVKGTSLDNV